jgi:hypothetical protein
VAKIPFSNQETWNDPAWAKIPESEAVIPVLAEIKLWSKKYSHLENQNDINNNPQVGKGDDIGFILAFGNDGEVPCPATIGMPTVEDTLDIKSAIDLKLMSLCICDDYEVWVVSENNIPVNYEVKRCHIFQSGIYKLQLRKKVLGQLATPYFEIPCHYICCISMLFQIEFPVC